MRELWQEVDQLTSKNLYRQESMDIYSFSKLEQVYWPQYFSPNTNHLYQFTRHLFL